MFHNGCVELLHVILRLSPVGRNDRLVDCGHAPIAGDVGFGSSAEAGPGTIGVGGVCRKSGRAGGDRTRVHTNGRFGRPHHFDL